MLSDCSAHSTKQATLTAPDTCAAAFAGKHAAIGDGHAVKTKWSDFTMRFLYGLKSASTGKVAAVIHASNDGLDISRNEQGRVLVKDVRLEPEFDVFGHTLANTPLFGDSQEASISIAVM